MPTRNSSSPSPSQAKSSVPGDYKILAEHAVAIRALGKQAVENVVEIGRRLTECRALLKQDGKWRAWLKDEFGWVESSSRNFINVYELSKSEGAKFAHADLPLSSLYLLAAPSTPVEARDEIVERTQAGETIPVAKVKRIIKDSKSRARASSKTGKSKPSQVAPKPPADIGPASASEIACKDAEIKRLHTENRRLEIKIWRLEIKIEELRGKPKPGTVSEFLTAIEIQKNIIRDLENENAKLRAGVATSPPDDSLDIPKCLLRSPREISP
jgi:hypothetical protein